MNQKNSLTGQLVNLIQAREIINEDLEACTFFVLDAIVNAIAGAKTDAGKIMMKWWEPMDSTDTSRQAFLGGALIHTLEMDDLHKQSVTHPGCVVVPAAIAVAAREGLSGKQLLVAILQGYEAMCRIGNAVGRSHYKIWHSTATCGPFGSAMAAGNLLGLSPEQQVWALGNAGTQSSGLWEFMNSGGMSKHLHAGKAAEAGILAADLAKLGFTGPTKILEGEQGMFQASCTDANPSELVTSPHAAWQLSQTSIKPWPCCRHTHPAIDAALEISSKINAKIQKVMIRTYQAAIDVCDRPNPDNEYEAKFSLQHCVAVALNTSKVGFDSFTNSAQDDTAKIRNVIQIEFNPIIDVAYPGAWGSEVEVVTEDGQLFNVTRLHCKGDPERPLDSNEMIKKARTLLKYAGIEEEKQEHLIKYILDLQNLSRVPGIIEILNFKF
ncbi:MAG: 2-methylcitrate dehydratase PrpD [Gammaproteobacteria bacterium]|jgi:2-methylcitrate dehydratase PrpD